MGARRFGSDLRRLLRGVWPGSNPLRRRTDWFETITLGCAVLALFAAVLLSLSVSGGVLRDHLEIARVEQSTRHQVTATVVTEVESADALNPVLRVRWGQPPHPIREGFVTVDSSLSPQSPIPIWVDEREQITTEPKTRADVTQAAGMAGAGVLLGCAWVSACLYGLAWWWVQRCRLAAWEAEWERVGPQWRKYTS